MIFLKRLLLALLVLLPVSSNAQLKSIDYLDIESFRIHNTTAQEITVVLNLRFYNPNRYGLTLKDGDVDAWINSNYLGKAIMDEKTRIPARDTFVIPATLTAPLDKIFTNILELLANKTIRVKLDGTIKAGKAGIFIRVPVRYEGEQQLDLDMNQ